MDYNNRLLLNNINNDLEVTNKLSSGNSNKKNQNNEDHKAESSKCIPNINNNNLHEPLLEENISLKIVVHNEKGLNAFGNPPQSIKDTFKTALYLGFICFGGPAAHIGVFRKVCIDEKNMLNENEFSLLFSICNILPGPTSTQLFTAIATISTNSIWGGLINFLGFNMPGLLILISIATYFNFSLAFENDDFNNNSNDDLLHNSFRIAFLNGISQAAIALIIQAGISLGKKQTKMRIRYITMLTVSAIVYYIFNKSYYVMIIIMFINGLINLIYKSNEHSKRTHKPKFEKVVENIENNNINTKDEVNMGKNKSVPNLEVNINENNNTNIKVINKSNNKEEVNHNEKDFLLENKNNENKLSLHKAKTTLPDEILSTEYIHHHYNIKNINYTGLPSFILFIVIYIVLFVLKLYFNSNYDNEENKNKESDDLYYVKLINIAEIFYRIGFLVVGGGHVVIPMILAEFTALNYLYSNQVMLAFSLASIMPGPLFNMSGFIGTLVSGIIGGFVAAISIFTPGLLLVFSVIPAINYIKKNYKLLYFLKGVSASAIGFIFTSAAVLWTDICLNDPSNDLIIIILGTINILICFFLLEIKNLNILLVLLFGVAYSVVINWLLL